MSIVKVTDNSLGDGDWVEVTYCGAIVYEGHSISSSELVRILRLTQGCTEVTHLRLKDFDE